MRNLHAPNYVLIAFTIVYTMGIGIMMWTSVELLGNARNFPMGDSSVLIISWMIICCTSVYWWPSLMLLFENIRPPIFEEEERINYALTDLAARINNSRTIHVLINDSESINAAATGRKTIIISTGALKQLTTEELAAIFAHEIGHLNTFDTACSAAISLSTTISTRLAAPIKLLFRQKLKWLTILQCAVMIIALYFMFDQIIFKILLAVIILARAPTLWISILKPWYLLASRSTEFRQDAFAHELGYGRPLRSAFLKIIASGEPPPVSRWHVWFNATHPVTHDRIRRLDQLQELSGNFSNH